MNVSQNVEFICKWNHPYLSHGLNLSRSSNSLISASGLVSQNFYKILNKYQDHYFSLQLRLEYMVYLVMCLECFTNIEIIFLAIKKIPVYCFRTFSKKLKNNNFQIFNLFLLFFNPYISSFLDKYFINFLLI